MDEIALLHRRGQRPFQGLAPEALVWKTCLRQILFLNEAPKTWEADEDVFTGAEAVAFLLEIICGLKSPVVGETEVFGQFKKFIGEASEQTHPVAFAWKPVFNSLIQMAKSLRAEHLVGLGSQGYGSLVRKLTKSDAAVSFLGAGQLVQEILPWLAKEKSLQILCRQPEKAQGLVEKYASLRADSLAQNECRYSCLVVAAPLSDLELKEWLITQGTSVEKILDLRAELQSPELFKEYHFVGLRDFFASIEKNKLEMQSKIIGIKSLVHDKSLEFYNRTLLRPYGWEDLCV